MSAKNYRRLCLCWAMALTFPFFFGCKKKSVTVNQPSPPPITSTHEPKPASTPKAMPSSPKAYTQNSVGPKISHPDKGLITASEIADPARDHLRKEFAGIAATDPKFYETVRRLWTEFSLTTFDRAVSSARKSEIATGAFLPPELQSVLGSDPERYAKLPFAKEPKEVEAVRMLGNR